MGVEYYLVKPNKKEIFYLGKHVMPLEGIKTHSIVASYIEHDCFHDFFLDVIDTNDGFLGDEWKYGDVKEFAYLLYQWCENDVVYFSHDCCEDFETFKDYKETGSIIDFCEKHPCCEG